MNKIKSPTSLLLIALSTIMILANRASAAMVSITNPIGTDDFTDLVGNFLSWLLSIAGSLAMLMLVWGGIMYMGSAGDEQKAAKGKKVVTWAILGLILVLSSFAIISLMEDILVN